MTTVAYWGPGLEQLDEFSREMQAEWQRRGYTFADGERPDAEVVFN